MKRFAAAFLLVWLFAAAWAQQAIHLKSRGRFRPAAGAAGARAIPRPFPGHYILQFRSYPGPAVRAELARRNIRVVGYVPDSALMVSAPAAADLSGLDIDWAGPLEAADKISPLLRELAPAAYLVIFHADVEPDRAREVVRERGLDAIPNPYLLPGHVLAAGSFSAVSALAASDEVAYVMPASPDLVAGNPVTGCAGAATDAGMVAEYAQVGAGWSKDSTGVAALKYFFQSVTEKLAESVVRSEAERAFNEWQRYANISVTPGDRADAVRTIVIQFARRAHGDGYPFDGPGGTLAHTFYPSPPNSETIAGDMHLDADEDWHAGSNTDLFSVVLHEMGHALGLGHTDRPGAVMYPYYHFSSGLTDDDVAGIRALYGARGDSPPPSTPPTPPTPPEPPPTPKPPSPPTPPSSPPPPTPDATPPSLRILSPGATIVSTSAASIHMTGTANDNVGVTEVRFSTSTGESGAASGTANWAIDVPLLVGNTVVTVRAYDAAGNSSWRSVTVVRH